jgi:hypothetical protein
VVKNPRTEHPTPNGERSARRCTQVQAETSGHNGDSFPAKSIVTDQFPANNWRPEVKLVWYDGGNTPCEELCEGKAPGGSGKLVVGDKGRLWGYAELTGGAEPVGVEFPKSPGHFQEWVRAIKGGAPAMSDFPDDAGPLSAMVLAGCLAVCVAALEGPGAKIEWDATNMKVKNIAGLESLVKPGYREGYTLDA